MKGLAPALAETETTTVLIHEWVTGGGLAGQSLPPSWAAEGHAMRRAIAGDFARLPGVRVLVTLDERFDERPGPWSITPVGPRDEVAVLQYLAAESHYTVLIAPETDGVLADRTRAIEGMNTLGLGSSARAIAFAGDKLRLGQYLSYRGITTPPCLRVIPGQGLPADFRYPGVLKPIDGAGSQDTYLVRAADALPEQARTMPVALLQPLVRGVPYSASFLVGRDGRAHLIAAGRQHVEIREDRFFYRGGTVPVPPRGVADGPRRAVESVAGLRGFVGVDYIWDEVAERATVLEINPRPTTSYVGLARWLPPGALGQAWLQVVVGIGGTERYHPVFPDADPKKTVTFAADGGMMGPSQGAPHERYT
jgi:predicted ATP-grasp superfamily ATP-dependent carboligase